METITRINAEESKKTSSETHILKSDGTTEKAKIGRALTSQEESILLPLIQGLIAAGNGNSSADKTKESDKKSVDSSDNAKLDEQKSKGEQSSLSSENSISTAVNSKADTDRIICNFSLIYR